MPSIKAVFTDYEYKKITIACNLVGEKLRPIATELIKEWADTVLAQNDVKIKVDETVSGDELEEATRLATGQT